ASTMAVQIAGEVDPLPEVPEDGTAPRLGIHSRFALVAGREAWADAGLADGGADPERVGVFLGSGKGISEIAQFEEALQAAWGDGRFRPDVYMEVVAGSYDCRRRIEELYHRSASYLARAVGAQATTRWGRRPARSGAARRTWSWPAGPTARST
ncbi:MAG: beta-ketoacyl synthase N-terminal-like domain-containing protein, partial [Planctomycetota bacterium]